MPDYDKSDADHVVLTLPGTIIDEDYSLMLLENTDIDLATAILLDKVQKGKGDKISDAALKMLRKKKLVEGRKPHLYVSKMVAKATNQEVHYTLAKGFDDTECIEWVIKALKDHGVLSRKQIDELLWGKLPIDMNEDKKKEKIGNILAKMKKFHKIYFGRDRKWHLCDLA